MFKINMKNGCDIDLQNPPVECVALVPVSALVHSNKTDIISYCFLWATAEQQVATAWKYRLFAVCVCSDAQTVFMRIRNLETRLQA